MNWMRCSHPAGETVLQIVSPVPTKHWSNFDAIIQWKEQTSEPLSECRDDQRILLPPMRILDASIRESQRRRDWDTYRKVVETDPYNTVAPPWPPFALPPSSPSPQLYMSPPPPESSTSCYDVCHCYSVSPLEGETSACWQHVLEGFPPASPQLTRDHAYGEHISESVSPRTLSETTGTTVSSSLTPDAFPENAQDMGAVAAGELVVDASRYGAVSGDTEDLAMFMGRMMLECRKAAEPKPSARGFFEEDALADGDIYNDELEGAIRDRAAVAQELNWILMGLLPMG